jgi:hypothetical protein
MPTKDWRPSAAYLYILHLDSIALAWEYLRRNADYRREWDESGKQHPARDARNWGLHWRRRSLIRLSRN